VTTVERHARHGHRSAIFSVTGNSDFAQFLERALFARRFETILVNAEEVPLAVLPILLSALWGVGLVIVYSSASPSSEEQLALKSVAQKHFFPVAAILDHAAHEVLEQALASAETLRAVSASADERKVGSNAFSH
jgi:hypothetical protein